ncbi:MAG TPA: hypothetical protein VEZ17_16235 [Chitinophagaceae bacterium]|jgi:hypothetical protein|nr:hypothetical protein [Chitinophagaceae bacterium]
MKGLIQKLVIFLIVLVSGLIGLVKGPVAKQKFVLKRKIRKETRRQLAENRSIVRKGGVLLDDIELAAYHN